MDRNGKKRKEDKDLMNYVDTSDLDDDYDFSFDNSGDPYVS